MGLLEVFGEGWEENYETLFQDLVGSDLKKHDDNSQFESQMGSQLKPKDFRFLHGHFDNIEYDDLREYDETEDWIDDPERAWCPLVSLTTLNMMRLTTRLPSMRRTPCRLSLEQSSRMP